MGGIRRHRRGTAWLAIIALVSNVLAGAFGAVFANAASAAHEGLGPLVICTANGIEVAPTDGGDTKPQSAKLHCPACTLTAGFALLATVAFSVLAFPPPAAPTLALTRSRAPVRHLSLGGIGSRAPPLSA
jgi:Protein of unknown function (DUF2946)